MIDLGASLQLNSMNSQSRGSQDLLKSDRKSSQSDAEVNSKSSSSRFADRLKDKNIERNDKPSKPTAESKPDTRQAERAENSEQESTGPKKAVTRQAAMSVFLQKMQSELGVDTEELMQAFSELSAEDLMASPEESAKSVIANLGLDQNQSEKALGFYNEMLAMTAAASMSAQLNQNNQTADFHVLSKKEAQQQELKASLNDLSDRFFVTGSHMSMRSGVDQQAKIAQAQSAYAQAQVQSGESEKNDGAFQIGLGATSAAEIAALAAETAQVDMGAQAVPAGMTAMNNADTQASNLNSDELAQAMAQKSALNADLASTPDTTGASDLFSLDAKATAAGLDSATDVNGATAAAVSTVVGGAAAQTEDESGKDDMSSGDEFILQDRMGQSQAQKVDGAKPFHINAPQASAADISANVKEIISQARYLADKGGGEMKVKLNPEGMGELDLKVKMVNGNVSVEMVTSNDEAKKLLEKGLSELKDNLATHKLHLDSVKIDNSKDISKHMDQQLADSDRGFEQKFLGEFRERNQGWKREMLEFGSPTVPESQTRERIGTSGYGSRGDKRKDMSRRLDLVA